MDQNLFLKIFETWIKIYFLFNSKLNDQKLGFNTSLNQSRGMPAKMVANGIRTHTRANQRHTCDILVT